MLILIGFTDEKVNLVEVYFVSMTNGLMVGKLMRTSLYEPHQPRTTKNNPEQFRGKETEFLFDIDLLYVNNS